MRVKEGRSNVKSGQKSRFLQLDYLGNLIFIPSTTSLLPGLVIGGIGTSMVFLAHHLTPVLGILGWIAFHIQQHFSSNPSVPTCLFSNRTSTAAFVLTNLTSICPVYLLPRYGRSWKMVLHTLSRVTFMRYEDSTMLLFGMEWCRST
ncbi:hypothetical protein EAF04_010922 [Stromatinia cepivora]|nr:hypothetical protein EAF04_010922 [Stromatinia cepivora]